MAMFYFLYLNYFINCGYIIMDPYSDLLAVT